MWEIWNGVINAAQSSCISGKLSNKRARGKPRVYMYSSTNARNHDHMAATWRNCCVAGTVLHCTCDKMRHRAGVTGGAQSKGREMKMAWLARFEAIAKYKANVIKRNRNSENDISGEQANERQWKKVNVKAEGKVKALKKVEKPRSLSKTASKENEKQNHPRNLKTRSKNEKEYGKGEAVAQ